MNKKKKHSQKKYTPAKASIWNIMKSKAKAGDKRAVEFINKCKA